MSLPSKADDSQLTRQHYLLEKRLAQRIMASSRQDRVRVTMDAYNELFSSIPWHPARACSEEAGQASLREKWVLFGHLLGPHASLLEIGAGNGDWTRLAACKTAGRCVGIDISREVLVSKPGDPPNLELRVMDAVDLDLPANTFDLAISDQLIEHLHPDDVELHLASV